MCWGLWFQGGIWGEDNTLSFLFSLTVKTLLSNPQLWGRGQTEAGVNADKSRHKKKCLFTKWSPQSCTAALGPTPRPHTFSYTHTINKANTIRKIRTWASESELGLSLFFQHKETEKHHDSPSASTFIRWQCVSMSASIMVSMSCEVLFQF